MSGPTPMPPCQRPDQMRRIPLSDLRAGHENRCIRVRASRVWHYRGDLEDSEVTELRMVFLDEKGDSICDIVPHQLVSFNITVIHEASIYDISVFEVLDQPQDMKPVENPLVIMVGELTVIRSLLPQAYPKNFPEWTYMLTPIISLPDPTDLSTRYIDVMGVIRAIYDVATLSMPGRNVLVSRSGNKVRITLWGETAFRFNGQVIRFLGDNQSAAVIFVALTVSMVEGSKELSGSSACRWYINEDIKETNVLQVSLLSLLRPIKHLPIPRQMTLRTALDFPQPVDQLFVIFNNNHLHHQPARFRCVVRIWRLIPGSPWWFTRCISCFRPAEPVASLPGQAAKYSCLSIGCPCAGVTIEYRLQLLGSDDTREAEFTMFGRLAQDIIGVSAQQLILNNLKAGANLNDLPAAATSITHTPPELAAIMGWRYKLVLSHTANSI